MRIFLWILAVPVVYLFLGTFMVYVNRAMMGVASGLFWMDEYKKFNFKKNFLNELYADNDSFVSGLNISGSLEKPLWIIDSIGVIIVFIIFGYLGILRRLYHWMN